MMHNAKNGKVKIDNTYMDYVSFGKGNRFLIMIPGLGDGLKTVKGMAIPLSLMYKEFAREYTVFIFSRKRKLPKQYSSRDMAKDLMYAMEKLDIDKADILGISQGGTIAQYLAIDYPQVVNKLVLTVTYSKPNDTIFSVIEHWISLANAGDYANILIDTSEKMYSENYLKKNRKLYPLLTKIHIPKSYDRFITLAHACLTHDAHDRLTSITCPTLIIGGNEDKIVTREASLEMYPVIKNSELYLYDGFGHGVYEEAEDFNQRVLTFFLS